MKKFAALFLSATLIASGIGSAQADWGRGDWGRYRDYDRPAHHHHHRDGRNWIGPAAVLAITGLALGAAAYNNSYATPAPAYVEPATPVYAAPPANGSVWYYCGSSDQYYPYTRACPEGWQAVPAR